MTLIPGLPPHIVPLEPINFTYTTGHSSKKVKLRQFPVTLTFVMTDYKCQAQTYDYLVCDLKMPQTGTVPVV